MINEEVARLTRERDEALENFLDEMRNAQRADAEKVAAEALAARLAAVMLESEEQSEGEWFWKDDVKRDIDAALAAAPSEEASRD